MSVTAASFRVNYPEFASTTVFPDAGVNYWLTVAALLLNVDRWYDALDLGTELFIAHHLVLEAQAAKTAAVGGVPGVGSGLVASKGVDKVNISYDTTSSIEEGAGHWNLTIYGTRFISLARMFGSGPVRR